jgi:hypothetical protein
MLGVAGRDDGRRLDHHDHGPSRRAPVNDSLRDRHALVDAELDRLAVFDVDVQLTVEYEEELVLELVLVAVNSPSTTPRRTTASLTVVSVWLNHGSTAAASAAMLIRRSCPNLSSVLMS